MARFEIEVDEAAIQDQVSAILNKVMEDELMKRYSGAGAEISAAVKDLIYSRKDEIVEMVVDRAVKEIVKKGMPKLIERFGD